MNSVALHCVGVRLPIVSVALVVRVRDANRAACARIAERCGEVYHSGSAPGPRTSVPTLACVNSVENRRLASRLLSRHAFETFQLHFSGFITVSCSDLIHARF